MPDWITNPGARVRSNGLDGVGGYGGYDAQVLVLLFAVGLLLAAMVAWASRRQKRNRAGWEVD